MQEYKSSKVDWIFLLFLAGATNVKLYVKLAVVILYIFYCLHKRYTFKVPVSLQWFYILMPFVGFTGALLHNSFDNQNYFPAFLFGSFYWFLAGAVSYLLYITVVNTNKETLRATVKMFFAVNAIISIGELVVMMIDSGHIMPYWYWGPDMYYGGATGDHIFGITANISVTNAMITALGTLYFVINKEIKWALQCAIISMLCTSNLTLIFLLIVLSAIILLWKDRKMKIYAAYIFVLSSAMYPVLTYDNIEYLGTVYTQDIKYKEYTEAELATIQKITSLEWKKEEMFEVSATTFKQPNNNYYKTRLNDTFATSYGTTLKYIKLYDRLKTDKTKNIFEENDIKKLIQQWYGVRHEDMALSTFHNPIKLYTNLQTVDYLMSDMRNLIAGAGIGNFSSKQAIKTTGLGLQGTYPIKKLYASKSFLEYHMYSLLYVLGLPVSEHSIINMPNSVYNQIAGEYGLLGILLFVLLYMGYVWKKKKVLGATIFIVLLTMAFLGFEYWFEMISLTVIFELLVFMKIYDKGVANG